MIVDRQDSSITRTDEGMVTLFRRAGLQVCVRGGGGGEARGFLLSLAWGVGGGHVGFLAAIVISTIVRTPAVQSPTPTTATATNHLSIIMQQPQQTTYHHAPSARPAPPPRSCATSPVWSGQQTSCKCGSTSCAQHLDWSQLLLPWAYILRPTP